MQIKTDFISSSFISLQFEIQNTHMNTINYLLLLTLILLTFSLSSHLQAQEWELINNVPSQLRDDHHNGFGYNGKGYIIDGSGSRRVWEYSPDTDTWVRLADFPGPSREIAIGDDWNGKYYYGFGVGGTYLNDLWEFNPVDTSWTQLPSCPCQGRSHPALIAHNDKVFMGTGTSFSGDLDDWWEYDMITQEWTQKEDIPGGNRHHPFQFAIDNYVYVGGGHRTNWVRYDIETSMLNPIDNTPSGRVAGSQFSYDGWGFLLGGDTASHSNVPVSQSFMAYDPQLEEWMYLPSLPRGSRWAPGSFIIDDVVYFFGGLSDTFGYDATMWKFDLTILACMPPSDLNVFELDEISARLMWSSSSNSTSDTLRWRQIDEVWNTVADAEPVFQLDNLEPCQAYEFQIVSNCGDQASYSEIFAFETSCEVGLSDANDLLKISIYPNPFEDVIRLSGTFSPNKEYQLSIIDGLGKIVRHIDNFQPDSEIDVSALTSGVYFLKVEDESSFVSIKLVK